MEGKRMLHAFVLLSYDIAALKRQAILFSEMFVATRLYYSLAHETQSEETLPS
jgi:aminoglycoside/choline kinase family phosphotransferase